MFIYRRLLCFLHWTFSISCLASTMSQKKSIWSPLRANTWSDPLNVIAAAGKRILLSYSWKLFAFLCIFNSSSAVINTSLILSFRYSVNETVAGDTSKRPQTSEQILLLAASLCQNTVKQHRTSNNRLIHYNAQTLGWMFHSSLRKKAISTHVDLVFDEQIRLGWIQS